MASSRFRGVRLQYSFATLETRSGNSSRGASRNCFWDLREYSFLLFSKWRVNVHTSSLRKHPFLFAAGDVSRETSLAAKSVEKRMFSQATKRDVWVPGSYRGLYHCIKSSVLLICTVVLLVFCLQ